MEHPEAPEGKFDKWGFTIKPSITDDDLIYLCLKNAPEGVDRKQVASLIRVYESIRARPTGAAHIFPQPNPNSTTL